MDHLILRTEVGSTVHGTGLEGHEDHDEMAVAIMPPSDVLGTDPFEGLQWRTADEGVRSTPADTDLAVYSLRKFLRLAGAGNPSILVALFGPPEKVFEKTWEGERLLAHRHSFVSKQAGRKFLGYMDAQRRRMQDSKDGLRAPRSNRPELVAAHGYDTKFAMHMLRLGFQGLEFMETSAMTLPVSQPTRDLLVSVRKGEVPYEQVIAISNDLTKELEDAIEDSGHPDHVDWDLIQDLSVEMHFSSWLVA
jgi:predicted nucleotidyltransferase